MSGLSKAEFLVLLNIEDEGRPSEISQEDWDDAVLSCKEKSWITADMKVTEQGDYVLEDDFVSSHGPDI